MSSNLSSNRRSRRRLAPLAVLVLASLVAGCAAPAPSAPATAAARPPVGDRSFAILAVNDVYRIEGVDAGARGHLARLRTLRQRLEETWPDLLLLHAGDAIYPSFASRTFDGEQMIDVLNLMDGDGAGFDDRFFATLGNHEFDADDLEDAALLDDRIEESAFWWFATNVRFKSGEKTRLPLVAGHNLLTRTLVDAGGVRVGLFGITIDNKQPEYVESFGDHEATAREQTAALRQAGAEFVVALTHLDMRQDAGLLSSLRAAGPDLIVGGHDHNKQAEEVGGRWVVKADADAVTASLLTVTLPAGGGPPVVEHRWVDLDGSVPLDPVVAERVAFWGDLHDRLFCAKQGQQPGCLAVQIGRTDVELVAEELEIRRFETNLGDWVADRMLEPFDDASERPAGTAGLPLVAFINSGSLRLNQDVPPGPVTRQTIEELFAYPAPLQLIEIDGRTLKQVAARAVEGWSGGGWWLQIAGFAFRHDPQAGTATAVTLLTDDGPRPVRDDEKLLAVTQRYLVDPAMGDQDGYTMLGSDDVLAEGPDLKLLVIEALGDAMAHGIAPRVVGRICNPVRDGLPCLAVGDE